MYVALVGPHSPRSLNIKSKKNIRYFLSVPKDADAFLAMDPFGSHTLRYHKIPRTREAQHLEIPRLKLKRVEFLFNTTHVSC